MLDVKSFAVSALFSTALVAGATAAVAAPAPVGARFPLSNCNTCSQRVPAIATLPNGNFFAGWEGVSAQDPIAALGRFFKAAGTAGGAPILLTSVLPPDQFDVDVAADATGYVAVWTSISGVNSDVFAQRFSTAGARTGNPILVNVDAPGSGALDFKPGVTKLPGGGFAVVWNRSLPPSSTSPGTPPDVLSRVYSAAGTPLGAPVKISTGLVNGDRPGVCSDTQGRFVAVWTTDDALRPFEPSKIGVAARRMSKTNVPQGTQMVIAPPVAGDSLASVACGKGNVFVVAWQSDQSPAVRRADILAARYQMTGQKVGATILVNKITDRDQKNPSVSFDPAGNFVVVWESQTDAANAIVGRRFTNTGAPTGDDFSIFNANHQQPRPSSPDVAHQGATGNFLVVWQAEQARLFGQRYKP
jgi:hypothetical protein